MDLPFDGGISRFANEGAPPEVRAAIAKAKKGAILNPSFPYEKQWNRKEYKKTLSALQIELVKMQTWARETGQRIAVVFEGRDAAGKGGAIQRLRQNLNPRHAKNIALSKPTEYEAAQWYFQRYVRHLPAAGEIAIFDRSWYNRAVVEHVFGFCTPDQRAHWFTQTPAFEQMLVDEGITLFKFWLNIGQATQLKRFLDRESDPLKQWKLSWIDVAGLEKWDAYSAAIDETLSRTHTDFAPWQVVRADDKRRARVAVIQAILSKLDYAGKSADLAAPDPKIIGGPDIWHG